VNEFCREEGIPVLLELPDDRRIAEAYSRGQVVVEALPEYRRLFENLLGIIARLSGASLSGREQGPHRQVIGT
jgi:MinD superfamily P-loop ATPase